MPLFKKTPRELDAPTPLGAITASGQTFRVASYTDATHLSQLRQQWQQKAFDIYDTEGHLFYATNYVGSALARLKLVAAKRPAVDGDPSQPEIITTGPIAKAVRSINSDTNGQTGILRQLGKNIFLTGEAWLIAEPGTDMGGKAHDTWSAVSVDELTNDGAKTFQRRRLPGAQPVSLQPGSLTIRIWKEHPRFSDWADAGTRSCMELLEKIVILNRAEKAIARSRLAGSGILALPQELVPPAWQNQSEVDNPMQANPLWHALAESMMAPLADEGHPSAVVPFLLVGPGEIIKNMKYEELNRSFDTRAAQLSIMNAIEQIANTLELPKEILLGTGEATHWTAWAIREDVFQAHIQPLIELICEALTRTYLAKALSRLSPEELKKAGITDPNDVMVWYDASQLIIRPDKSDKAIALHDRLAISDEALRVENGYGNESKPSEEEYARRVGVKVADPQMAVTGKPTELPRGTDGKPDGPKGVPKAAGGGGPLP
jgi:hypothetical protein